VVLCHISNVRNINPIEEIIEKAHKVGAVLIDGAQAFPFKTRCSSSKC
jgi:cysteine desulfurase/selenocysteine lyase